MIVVVGRYANGPVERDGMVQRIKYIDTVLATESRVYLDLSIRRNILASIEQIDNVTIYHLNQVLHRRRIVRLLRKANVIYYHSILNFQRVGRYSPVAGQCSFLDLHGVVPEELEMAGQLRDAEKMQTVERKAIMTADAIVVVSDNMAEHIMTKYNITKAHDSIITLPHAEIEIQARPGRSSDNDLRIVYVGGIRPWQNVPLMVEVCRGLERLRTKITFLVPDIEGFMHISGGLVGLENVEVASEPHAGVAGRLLRADVGFVLRNDTVVNRVAVPTKLIEYLACGVVPIVIQPVIGDFARIGYKYLTVDDILTGRYTITDLEAMRQHNYGVLRVLQAQARQGGKLLHARLGGCGSSDAAVQVGSP